MHTENYRVETGRETQLADNAAINLKAALTSMQDRYGEDMDKDKAAGLLLVRTAAILARDGQDGGAIRVFHMLANAAEIYIAGDLCSKKVWDAQHLSAICALLAVQPKLSGATPPMSEINETTRETLKEITALVFRQLEQIAGGGTKPN